MRESWTDDRLDDLNGKVDALRVEIKAEFAAVRSETRDGFDKIDRRFEKADERFEKFEIRSDERFEAMMDHLYSMQRLMIQFCGAAMVALVGFLATQV